MSSDQLSPAQIRCFGVQQAPQQKKSVCLWGLQQRAANLFLPMIQASINWLEPEIFLKSVLVSGVLILDDGWNTSHPLYTTIFKITFTETSVLKSFANLKGKQKLGGGFKYMLFSPLFGEMVQFYSYFFQLGWNHQLESLSIHMARFRLHPNLSPNGWRLYIPVTWGLESRCLGPGLLSVCDVSFWGVYPQIIF